MANHHQLRLFPHSHLEFPSMELLTMWLLNGLRARGGVYHLRNANAFKDLSRGSVVLFRWEHRIVGEAVVWKEKEVFKQKLKDWLLLGGREEEYEAQVTFAPSSIRLYAPPLPAQFVQDLLGASKDIKTYPGAYVELDWDLYAAILAEVVAKGTFIA
jgi:hypothetical protein